MAKDSILVSPATPLAKPSVKPSGKCVYDTEPGQQARTKSPNQQEEVRRVLGTQPGRLPQPTKK